MGPRPAQKSICFIPQFLQRIVIVGFFITPIFEAQSLPEDLGAGRFSAALFTLGGVTGGAVLLKKAIRLWELEDFSDLLKRFKWGNTSRTDTILTRYYNPKTGKEDRESEVTVYLRQDQSQFELVMDMAHELVHATARAGFDPYDSSLTVGKYIWAAIEGEGGEVQATMTECQIGLELAVKQGTKVARCNPYLESTTPVKNMGYVVSRAKVLRDFYRVGKWQMDLNRLLGREIQLFPLLSKDTPKLYSSTGHTPYPIALFHEFEEITETACKNSHNRMRSFASPFHNAFAGESTDTSEGSLKRFISKRCH
ncbi:MAG: hypothetical protein ABI041_16215 [Bdellovibrionia bacterium]